jgi:hypothetical protein
VVIKNASFTGCSQANQTAVYTGGGRLSLDSGVVLSSGFISHLTGGTSGSCRGQGYAPLDKLITGVKRQRHKTVECEIDSDSCEISLDYVFGSNEYSVLGANDETAKFNDLAAIFLIPQRRRGFR